jgi:hypothetical protein
MMHRRGRVGFNVDNGLLMRSFLWLGMIEAALCYAYFSVYSLGN